MKINELTAENVKNHLRIDYSDTAVDCDIQMAMDGAKAYLIKQTGLSEEQLNGDNADDLTIAYLALCCDFYENRGVISDSNYKENMTVKTAVYGNAVNYIK